MKLGMHSHCTVLIAEKTTCSTARVQSVWVRQVTRTSLQRKRKIWMMMRKIKDSCHHVMKLWWNCILTLLIILIKPLTTKAYDRRASGDCGTSGSSTASYIVMELGLHYSNCRENYTCSTACVQSVSVRQTTQMSLRRRRRIWKMIRKIKD